MLWIVGGVILAFIVSRLEYKKFYNLALPLLIVTFILLLLVFVPFIGMELKGANRWIDFKFLVFQPSELLKISLALYLSAWLSNKEKNRLFAFLILFIISVLLVAVEPDLGTSMIVAATSISLYFLSGAKITDMVVILLLLIVASFLLIKVEPYRVARLASFQSFDPNTPAEASYHVRQILIALGSGGITGIGVGKSIQKYAYLPENTTDSIFAIYAEETGFLGSVLLITLFFAHIFTGFLIAVKTQDKFGRLLASGLITFLGIQVFINLASQVVLIPLTGVPLPFISYGGSSMVINYISVGIIMSIGRKMK